MSKPLDLPGLKQLFGTFPRELKNKLLKSAAHGESFWYDVDKALSKMPELEKALYGIEYTSDTIR